ncbi:putative alpha,alpha-trehalose-phosphate synthase (UDP-forming) [Medicago truncatula]|uniref:Putative alpha,alpha-trehalose-phosphate synthase (UDP-forming) n=1 Tax=Medicago truncatula TaxID=3880 RepID=G7J499_MEDTR|nr:trehalose-6-phosphate synthase [Medicago truncatula]RHN68717.1 putative alpha,alpha-trehalose-phosphate synthase (UDP-forming) [Medicago truncatula]
MGSCINLVDLVSADNINFHRRQSNDHDSSAFSPEGIHWKMIIIANYLALNSKKDDITGRWCFSYDEDSIFRQLKDGLSSDIDVVYVGSLKVDVDKSEQDNVSQLLEEFNSFPTFIPSEIQKKFYDGFCKNYLWPLFHYMFPMYQSYCNGFDESLWQAYVSTNKIFANKIMS